MLTMLLTKIELLTIVTGDNPDIICINETPPKHTHLSMNEWELQVHVCDYFPNTTDSNYHGNVVIYVKK